MVTWIALNDRPCQKSADCVEIGLKLRVNMPKISVTYTGSDTSTRHLDMT